MADPLSIAGTVVGIVSLGLQVSQGLINYMQAVNGRKDEIEDSIRQVQRVVSLLSSLNSVISFDAKGCNQSVQDSLVNCYTKLDRLQKFLNELKHHQQPANSSRTVRGVTRSLSYPFQQTKLNSLLQSLGKDLDDLRFAMEIMSLDLHVTIGHRTKHMSQETATNSAYQNDRIHALQMQAQKNSVQLDSLSSTIFGALESIQGQLHQTQWDIRDLGQRVDGRLTVIESGINTISAHNVVTAKKMEEITQTLSSHSKSLSNMGIHILPAQRHTRTTGIEQDHCIDRPTLGSSISAPWGQIIDLSSKCNCASTLPTSRTSFALWHLKFELEVQEQHHRSCELFGIHRTKKRRAFLQFPLKVAWFSARMAFACLEYTSGTNNAGYSVRYKNVVHSNRSPVIQIMDEIVEWDVKSIPGTQIVQDIEAIECRIWSMYRDGTASPYDRNEYDWSHAEVFFTAFVDTMWDYCLLDKMMEDDKVLWAVLQVFRKLLEINDDTDGTLFATISKHKDWWQSLDLAETKAQNVHDFLCCMAKVSCFNDRDIYYLTWHSPSDPLKDFIQAAEDLSPLHRAIISQSLSDLIECVSKSPKSIFESISVNWNDSSIETCTVLHLVSDWPEGLQYLLSTDAKYFLDTSRCPERYSPPVVLASQANNAESVAIFLEAGCHLELSRRTGPAFCGTSTRCMEVIASHLANRRLELLELAQETLGIFIEGTTVALADLAATSICNSLDKANIPLDRILRVERDYKSIYSCTSIPVEHFCIFWDKGFRHKEYYDNLGLMPSMTYRYHMFCPPTHSENFNFLDSYSWMRDNEFLDVTPTDPRRLGLNLSSTAYHYIGAMFGSFHNVKTLQRPKQESSDAWYLIKELSSVQFEDNCNCWCNETNHGCSPMKLFLKSVLDERHSGVKVDSDILQQVILRHKMLEESHSGQGENPPGFVTELLRLLTFEALGMTHTCCSFEAISDDIVIDLVSTASCKPAAIFSCRAEKAQEIRSCAEERSSARLLEDLMTEFTLQLRRQGSDAKVFGHFVAGYWRRRMSDIYYPDPQVLSEMKQHQAFRGLKASSDVETYVLPERVLRLLGNDFKLAQFDIPEDDNISQSKEECLSDSRALCEYCPIHDTNSGGHGSGGDGSIEQSP